MTDEEYFKQLRILESQVHDAVPSMYFANVATRWFHQIAPVKHEHYGIECWERMGPKALLVDLSACYYRYKKLLASSGIAGRVLAPMKDVLLDHFGYCMLLCVAKEYTVRTDTFWRPNEYETPAKLNEYMLRLGWEGNQLTAATTIACANSLAMWETVQA